MHPTRVLTDAIFIVVFISEIRSDERRARLLEHDVRCLSDKVFRSDASADVRIVLVAPASTCDCDGIFETFAKIF